MAYPDTHDRVVQAAERVAYFTMEIALRSDIPAYAGGLGVLAGDMIRVERPLDLDSEGQLLTSGELAYSLDYAKRNPDIVEMSDEYTLDRLDPNASSRLAASMSRASSLTLPTGVLAEAAEDKCAK